MGYTDQQKPRASAALRTGAGDAFAKAFEIVATPAVFGCLGWFVDSRIGIFPAITLVAVIVVFSYQLWRFSRDYSSAMDHALDRRRAAYASSAGFGAGGGGVRSGSTPSGGEVRSGSTPGSGDFRSGSMPGGGGGSVRFNAGRRGLSGVAMSDMPGIDASDSAPAGSAPERAIAADSAPERAIAIDMVKRSVLFAVPLTAAGAIIWGWPGMASVALALGLVLLNFVLGAEIIARSARLGGGAMMAAVLCGYLVRLGIVTGAVLPILHHDWFWFEFAPFAVSLLVVHIGLLAVEVRYVSASAAFPGLKPGTGFGSSSLTSSSEPRAWLPLEPSARPE